LLNLLLNTLPNSLSVLSTELLKRTLLDVRRHACCMLEDPSASYC